MNICSVALPSEVDNSDLVVDEHGDFLPHIVSVFGAEKP